MASSPSTASKAALAADAGLDFDGLTGLLGFHLRLAHVAIYRDFMASLAEFDLTQKQCAVLQLIGANPAVSQVDLAAALGTDRATMMAVVDRLEQRGFVTRVRSKEDRRRQELYLTEDGETMLGRAKAAIAAHEAKFTGRFSAQELKALMGALGRIHQQV